jgi:hypothetical protein
MKSAFEWKYRLIKLVCHEVKYFYITKKTKARICAASLEFLI